MGHQTPVGLAAPSASTGANWAAPLPWGTNAAAWDPRTWLCKAAAAGWQRQEGDRMLGHTPAAMRKHGTPTPFLPHKAGPPPSSPSLAGIAPGGHERWPQRSSAPLAGRAQWHQPAAGTEEWLSLPAPERGAPTCAAQPRRSRAGLGTGWVDPARALVALAITTAECQGGRGRCPRCPSLVWTHSALEGLGSPGPQG